MAKLILSLGDASREYPVEGVLMIGRDPDNDVAIADDTVSGQHARLSLLENRVLLEDLDSLEGTQVNGRAIQRCVLHDGDEIGIGDAALSFSEAEAGAEEAGSAPAGPVGRVMGDYAIEASLGIAQQGEVFRATQQSTGNAVALKVLSEDLTQDPDFVQRFLKETESVKNLDHPYLIRYLDFGLLEGKLFFAMELFDGEPLQRRIEQSGRIRPSLALEVGITVAQALAGLAEHGLSHQDVRPMNIMLGANGEIRLVGLGLASLLRRLGGAKKPEILMGDPTYMAPEQHTGGQKIDVRADIYALGATMYHMLVGKPPFEGSVLSLISKHRMEARPNPSETDITIPAALSRLIRRMMEIEPEHRPSDPMKVARELAELRETLAETVGPGELHSSASSRVFKKDEMSSLIQQVSARLSPSAIELESVGSKKRADAGPGFEFTFTHAAMAMLVFGLLSAIASALLALMPPARIAAETPSDAPTRKVSDAVLEQRWQRLKARHAEVTMALSATEGQISDLKSELNDFRFKLGGLPLIDE